MKPILNLQRKALYSLFVLLAFLIVACDKKNDTPAPQKENKDSTFRIKRILTTWDENIDYHYNTDGTLATLNNGTSLVDELEPNMLYYEYNTNKKLSRVQDDHDNIVTYEYADQQLIRTKHYFGTMLRGIQTYQYNAQNRIVEATYTEMPTEIVDRNTKYTYDAKGNVTLAQHFRRLNNEMKLVKEVTYTEFDTKKSINPWYFLPGTISMVNNPGKQTSTHYLSNTPSVTTYTYQYNSSGYPTKLSYNLNGTVIANFTYVYEFTGFEE